MTTSRAWSFIPLKCGLPVGFGPMVLTFGPELGRTPVRMRHGRAHAAWRCRVERKLVVALAVFGLMFAACGGSPPAAIATPTATATASAKPSATESPDQVMARLYDLAKA